MKLLADENFPPSLVSHLQKKRHDVKRIQRTLKGIGDLSVRERSLKEKRIILSFDKDFLKSSKLKEQTNVMVLDFPNMKPEDIIPYMGKIINAISILKRKKKPFTAIFSEIGLEITK